MLYGATELTDPRVFLLWLFCPRNQESQNTIGSGSADLTLVEDDAEGLSQQLEEDEELQGCLGRRKVNKVRTTRPPRSCCPAALCPVIFPSLTLLLHAGATTLTVEPAK